MKFSDASKKIPRENPREFGISKKKEKIWQRRIWRSLAVKREATWPNIPLAFPWNIQHFIKLFTNSLACFMGTRWSYLIRINWIKWKWIFFHTIAVWNASFQLLPAEVKYPSIRTNSNSNSKKKWLMADLFILLLYAFISLRSHRHFRVEKRFENSTQRQYFQNFNQSKWG